MRAAAFMLAAKEGCMDVFECMLMYLDGDEACVEGALSLFF